MKKYDNMGYLFVLPFVVVFLIFSVYPVLRTLYLSFTNTKIAGVGDAAWVWFGNSFIMLMAGVQGISKDYYEAAAIDVAGRWTIFGKITLPLIKPILMYVAIPYEGGKKAFGGDRYENHRNQPDGRL